MHFPLHRALGVVVSRVGQTVVTPFRGAAGLGLIGDSDAGASTGAGAAAAQGISSEEFLGWLIEGTGEPLEIDETSSESLYGALARRKPSLGSAGSMEFQAVPAEEALSSRAGSMAAMVQGPLESIVLSSRVQRGQWVRNGNLGDEMVNYFTRPTRESFFAMDIRCL